MFSLPSSRRLVTPALILFMIAAFIRLCLQAHGLIVLGPSQHILKPFAKSSYNISFNISLSPQVSTQDRYLRQYHSSSKDVLPNSYIAALSHVCTRKENPHTQHIRLSTFPVLNISMLPSAADSNPDEFRNNQYFNPAMIPLPSHISFSSSTPYQYLLVSRLVTSGTHQESHICFANICTPRDTSSRSRACTDEDINILGPQGGMRCVNRPEKVNIPSTPARKCTGSWSVFPDIPGFHDPRIFWSGRGEPLIEINSGSMYGCIGLWLQDLRSVFPPLEAILKRKKHDARDGDGQKNANLFAIKDINALGAPIGYPRITELTRNPKSSRASVEKNWIVFFPSADEMWIQYNAMGKTDIPRLNDSSSSSLQSPGRTLSQVLSHGYTTSNLTSPSEPSCFPVDKPSHITDPLNNTGHWHQGTNSLRLILCSRSAFQTRTCLTSPPNIDATKLSNLHYEEILRASGAIVHFSIIHRKFTNEMDLPMRYERYVTVWEARPPYRFVAVSRYPIVFGSERVRPWSFEDDVVADGTQRKHGVSGGEHDEGENDAYFTYTPSIAWAYRDQVDESRYMERGHEDMGTGYLDDEVIVGIGMDDMRQGFVKVPVKELLTCLRSCPGVRLELLEKQVAVQWPGERVYEFADSRS